MVTWAPARCAVIAAVSPIMPQPMTAIFLGETDIAFWTATLAEPQDKDQPLPPWP